jgi:molecular chaperone GrpE (heat shock protein)
MLKRCIILGLVLLLAGSAVLGWVLAEKRKEQKQIAHYKWKYDSELGKELEQYDKWLQLPPEKRTDLPPAIRKYGEVLTRAQLQQQQQARLKADLDKLASGDPNARPLADFFYGENWQEEISKYKGEEELRELLLNSSIVFTSIGGAILGWCLLLNIARLLIRVSSRLRQSVTRVLTKRKQADENQSTNAEGQKDDENSQILPDQLSELGHASQEDYKDKQKCVETRRSKVAAKAGSHVSGEKAAESGESLKGAARGVLADTASVQPIESGPQDALSDSDRNPDPAKDSCRKRGGRLRRQVPITSQTHGFFTSQQVVRRESAGSPQRTGAENTAPLSNTLIELTQEVAAIREYASNQQDRVTKLQEGYDWNIIKNFCLRIIRCIDNVDNRIRERAGQNGEAACLQEIRDELLFALESSGIEQFEPEINSDYRGQEKLAEAVKERESCDDVSLTGKIARVIRPGYQYFIDDENVKVVRPAMVMLFA